MAIAQSSSAASARLRELARCIEEHAGFAEAVCALRNGDEASFDGVWGSSCALLAAALAPQAPATLVVVAPEIDDIDNFVEDLALFSSARPMLYPAWESEPGERVIHDDIYGERLRTLKHFLSAAPPRILITSIQSLLQPAPRREATAANTRLLRIGERIDLEDILRWLAKHHFHSTSAVELPGEFSSRGGILDLFAPDWTEPVRIELFDDEIESIRAFEISSQRSRGALESVDLTAMEPADAVGGHLADYLPPESWFLLLDPERLQDEGKQYLSRLEKPRSYHSVPQAMRQIGRHAVATAENLSRSGADACCHLQIESTQRFSGDIQRVRSELEQIGQQQKVFIVSQSTAEVERLSEIFKSTKLAAQGKLHFPLGSLKAGFRLPLHKTIVISGDEIFQRGQLRRTPRRRLGKAIDSFLDLREGDLVVHLAHGIGRYRGLKLLERDEQVEEHLEIEFHGGMRLFVPAGKIDLVQKYIGGIKRRPTLATIGGKSWQRQKKAAEAAVTDMAGEMLQLQASREGRPGIAFSMETDWQREFDASFPYQETPDQLVAIEAIKKDMLSARPMDRLLCGDVGFGKTELAMRAVFKAVENGYQAAILVPTTILAEQHYKTFQQRMAEFPFDIAKLSRFCTPKQQRETIEGLALGRIDVVIGTHRLASKDVAFYNLGLVIIDEEQRFGVGVKERLKTLRATVDILTMTATPIPRTLHMSLVGLRDISNLETAPEDRIAVETRVTRFDKEMIRHAVLRELNRGGQIFFVHNRVGDIEKLADRLREIVPEASLKIGHGQMREGELEKVMVDFVEHRFDMLLATTIVESGLDIPNANTIFIDEADRYGLADLHQLRGRVGRYKHRAYCYMLIDPRKHISPNAAKRLRAIEEFSEMGAGFSIAMRDLEIRGAGNLLGTQQSGHIAAVGYELYCQLLENAVRKMKKMAAKLTVDVDIDLPGEAYLPTDYVPDMRLKIDLYRRLCQVASIDQLAEFRSELEDRFGPPPKPAQRMLELTELKIDAAVWQIASIHLEDRYLVLRYLHQGRIKQLSKATGKKLRIVDDRSAYLPVSQEFTKSEEIIAAVKSVLRP